MNHENPYQTKFPEQRSGSGAESLDGGLRQTGQSKRLETRQSLQQPQQLLGTQIRPRKIERLWLTANQSNQVGAFDSAGRGCYWYIVITIIQCNSQVNI